MPSKYDALAVEGWYRARNSFNKSQLPLRGQRRNSTGFPILPLCFAGIKGTLEFHFVATKRVAQAAKCVWLRNCSNCRYSCTSARLTGRRPRAIVSPPSLGWRLADVSALLHSAFGLAGIKCFKTNVRAAILGGDDGRGGIDPWLTYPKPVLALLNIPRMLHL